MNIQLDIEPISSWGVDDKRPLVMAGPCSAETEEQVLETARGLQKQGIQIFRAGIWKPRTRPNMFEGVGSVGLQWMKKVKQETGMLTATEVANVKHVYEALKNGVDILWIGARTTANPFAVQEIADALSGVDIPVLVKNPVNPDLELWIGAIERIYNAGIRKLGAIHRGFSSYEKTNYRNAPMWQIAIDLNQRIPNLPIICDPSHITGKSELIYEVSQKAMDLGQHGLIIESHPNPKVALSDARQQVTPAQLGEILQKLVIRGSEYEYPETKYSLEQLRLRINDLDEELLKVIHKRMEVVKLIGQHKKENNIRIIQNKRWEEIIHAMEEKGSKYGFSNELIGQIFKAIHQESINIQTQILNS